MLSQQHFNRRCHCPGSLLSAKYRSESNAVLSSWKLLCDPRRLICSWYTKVVAMFKHIFWVLTQLHTCTCMVMHVENSERTCITTFCIIANCKLQKALSACISHVPTLRKLELLAYALCSICMKTKVYNVLLQLYIYSLCILVVSRCREPERDGCQWIAHGPTHFYCTENLSVSAAILKM